MPWILAVYRRIFSSPLTVVASLGKNRIRSRHGSRKREEVTGLPYKSAKQRRFLHAKHPELAAKWDRQYGGKVKRAKPKKRGR
jgi:hypothetical protein